MLGPTLLRPQDHTLGKGSQELVVMKVSPSPKTPLTTSSPEGDSRPSEADAPHKKPFWVEQSRERAPLCPATIFTPARNGRLLGSLSPSPGGSGALLGLFPFHTHMHSPHRPQSYHQPSHKQLSCKLA